VGKSDGPVDIYNAERADVSENESSYCRATMNRKRSEMDEALERPAIRNFGRINKKTAKEKYGNEEEEIPSSLFVHENGEDKKKTVCIKQRCRLKAGQTWRQADQHCCMIAAHFAKLMRLYANVERHTSSHPYGR
jgi:hypothetical protein